MFRRKSWQRKPVPNGATSVSVPTLGHGVWSPQIDIDLYGGLWWTFGDLANGAVSSWASHEGISQTLVQATGTAQPSKSASGVTADGGDVLSRGATGNVAKFVQRATLPDSTNGMSADGTGKGFTCTGLCRIPGTDEFWIANHGDTSAAHDGSGPWAPSLVRVNWSGGTITKLQEIALAPLVSGIESVQGVAFDTSDDTLWFASASAAGLLNVYHIQQDGTLLGDTITPSWAPNGLAYVEADDSLWITQNPSSGDQNIEKRSCVDGTVVIAAADLGFTSLDHLHYDPGTGGLLLSYSGNGDPGTIKVYGTSGASGARIAAGDLILDTHTDCLEGIVWEGTKLYAVSDSFYHTGADGLNQLVEYTVVPPLAMEINLHFKASVSATTSADTYFDSSQGSGDGALALPGFGVYPASTSTLTVAANTSSGTTQRGVISGASVGLMTSARVFSIKIDVTNDLMTLWVDGSLITTASLSTLVGGVSIAGLLRVFDNGNSRFSTATIKDLIIVTGPSNRSLMETYLGGI